MEEIMKLIFQEARKRNKDNYLAGLYSVRGELRDKLDFEILENERREWREKRD